MENEQKCSDETFEIVSSEMLGGSIDRLSCDSLVNHFAAVDEVKLTELLQKLMHKDPENDRISSVISKYFMFRQCPDTINLMEIFFTENKYWNGFKSIGNYYYVIGEKKRGIEYYQKSLAIKETAKVTYNLGNAYFHLNFYSDAIKCFKRAIHLDETLCYAFNNLAFIYSEMGLHIEAKEVWKKALVSYEINERIKSEQSKELYFWICWGDTYLYNLSLPEKAIPIYLQAINKFRETDSLTTIYLNLSNAFFDLIAGEIDNFRLGDDAVYSTSRLYSESWSYFKRADEAFLEICNRNEDDVDYHEWSELYMIVGKYNKVEELLLKSLSRNQYEEGCLQSLGKLYIKMERYLEASEYLKRADNINGNKVSIKFDLAYAYQRLGNFQKSEAIYDSISFASSLNTDVMMNLIELQLLEPTISRRMVIMKMHISITIERSKTSKIYFI